MTVQSVARVPLRHGLTDRAVVFSRVAALLTLVLLASRVSIGEGVTLGHLATLALVPLWFPALRRHTGGLWLAWAGLAATLASVWLTFLSAGDHETTQANLVGNTLLITGSVAAIGVFFWARQLLPVWIIGSVYAVGMLADVFLHQETIGFNRGSGGEVNPWKFAFAVPLAILALSLADRARRRWAEVLMLVLLAAASARFDSRSYLGEFAIAALLVMWQGIPARSRRTSALRVVTVFGIVAAIIYNVGTSLILGGALGQETQARSLEQVNRAGSIIVGGRPEMGATAALFLSRPIGFGGGTIATFADVNTAKAGMIRVNYDPENGYVENFLFGSKFELHSTAGDLWAYAGFAGILFALVCAVLILVIVGRGLAHRALSGLVLFALVQSFWDLFFNPLYSSAPVIVVALGLGLGMKSRWAAEAPAAPEHPPQRTTTV